MINNSEVKVKRILTDKFIESNAQFLTRPVALDKTERESFDKSEHTSMTSQKNSWMAMLLQHVKVCNYRIYRH